MPRSLPHALAFSSDREAMPRQWAEGASRIALSTATKEEREGGQRERAEPSAH